MDKPKIIFEDESLIVIDKPAGMIVNRAESVRQETVEDWIKKKSKVKSQKLKVNEESDFERRAGIVHRLDRETSGVLLAAKNEPVFIDLQRQFRERQVVKKYLVLVYGKMEPREGEIVAPLKRMRQDRKKFAVYPGGRMAETSYKVLKYYADYTLLEVYPKTGRTHQIRVHLKYFGHPVVADLKYGGKRAERDRKTFCPRQFLHAAYLKFRHPGSGKMVEIKKDLPEDLSSVLSKLCYSDLNHCNKMRLNLNSWLVKNPKPALNGC